jgi:NADH dehydrogenase/NADH:ubiquinone oxidoreductase subunit G
LMEVIRESGTEVPSMCFLENAEHFTSCMVCVVKDRQSGKILPSCSREAEEGMDIISMDEEVREARENGPGAAYSANMWGIVKPPARSVVRPTWTFP